MKSVSDNNFVYLLYLDRRNRTGRNGSYGNNLTEEKYVEGLFNWGLPCWHLNPEPILIDQNTAREYGIENIVHNVQRKFARNFNVVVVKVPEEFMRLESNYIHYSESKYSLSEKRCKALPMMRRYRLPDGSIQERIAPELIESVYLNDEATFARIMNYYWNPIPENPEGMLFSQPQLARLKANNDWKEIEQDEKKRKLMIEHNMTTGEVLPYLKKNFSTAREIGFNPVLVKNLESKYSKHFRTLRGRMNANQISALIKSNTQNPEQIEKFDDIMGRITRGIQ